MLVTQTKPCGSCPFRRTCAPGWLGEAAAEEFIDACIDDVPMPCHNTVNYENPNWREDMIELDSKVQHCAGARIMFRNMCKVSRHPYMLFLYGQGLITEVKADPDLVFVSREEFLKHHLGKWTR